MYLKSLRFRLITVFAAAFIVGTAALYVVTYLLFSTLLLQDERRLLESKLLEFWAVYQTGRSAALQREFTLEKYPSVSTPFYVRLSDRENEGMLLFRPQSWINFEFDDLPLGDVSGSGSFSYIKNGPGGEGLTYATLRLSDGNFLQVGVGNGRRITLLYRLRKLFLLISVPFILVGAGGGWLASSRALSPVKKLSTMSRFIIETGSLSRRIPQTGSRDELDELIGLFNQMVETIETLIRGMHRSLDDVAHDLRTPLTRLRMRAEDALLDSSTAEAKGEALSAIVSETEQMLTILRSLMEISEAESGIMRLERIRIDLGDIVRDISDLYSYTADDKRIDFSVTIEPGLYVSVDVNRIRQVFANLLDNAMKYTPESGRVEVRGKRNVDRVEISVSDTGVGIGEYDLPHIWDRLYRADRSRSNPGFGLGLGLVKAIVEAHGGTVRVDSALDKGSTFTASLPFDEKASTTQDNPENSS
jgi:signal transduction histidine kinase